MQAPETLFLHLRDTMPSSILLRFPSFSLFLLLSARDDVSASFDFLPFRCVYEPFSSFLFDHVVRFSDLGLIAGPF